MFYRSALRAALIIALVGMIATPSLGHDGHDHGAPETPVSTTIAPRADASSTDFELVAIARSDQLTIYLDSFRDNKPVGGAEIEIDTPAGLLVAVAAPESGVYTVAAPFLLRTGAYDLAITVSAGGTVDVLATTMKIPASTGGNATAVEAQTSWLVGAALAQDIQKRVVASDASLLAAAGGGLVLGVVLMLFVRRWRRQLAAALLLPAIFVGLGNDPAQAAEAMTAPIGAATTVTRDIAQRFSDGALFVPKPTQRILALRTAFTEMQTHRRSVELPGRVVPDPNASGLVQASGGGRLAPPQGGFKPLGTAIKAGEILAYVQPPLPTADATAQQQEARLLDQQMSIVTRKVERLRAIERVIARSQLEDAELELKGLTERRANLSRVNRTPEPLSAPVDGVIASANAVAGQVVEPNTIVFQIVDPRRLWIEALTFEPQAINGRAQGALTNGQTLDLAYLGTGLADRNQAVPVHFSVKGDTSALRAGQFISVLASTQEERSGIALPREAVLRGSNGQSIVYEHTNAERFVIREVRVEPLDGARVLVVSGVDAGKRIVTQGAELLNQIR